MITFPNAKINLGLNIINRRADGYHNLETIFYPIQIKDGLEVIEAAEMSFETSGIEIPGHANENLCLQAYDLLRADFDLPNIGFDEALKSVDASNSLPPIQLAQLNDGGPTQQVAAFGDPAEVSKSLIDKTKAWAKAWENKDLNSYIAFYAPNFKPEEGSYEAWVSHRRDRISKAQGIDIEISDLQVIPSFDKPDEYEISFIQDYSAKNYQERSKKILTWKESKGVWQIIREQNLPESTAGAQGKKNLNLALSTSIR